MRTQSILSVIFILLMLFFISGCGQNSNLNGRKYEDTISCIADNSEIYITTGCIACTTQAKYFGEDFTKLNVINCAEQPQKCLDSGIMSVPTWIIDGQKVVGVQSIERLKEFTGCK